jgi:hypothetical protein
MIDSNCFCFNVCFVFFLFQMLEDKIHYFVLVLDDLLILFNAFNS